MKVGGREINLYWKSQLYMASYVTPRAPTEEVPDCKPKATSSLAHNSNRKKNNSNNNKISKCKFWQCQKNQNDNARMNV